MPGIMLNLYSGVTKEEIHMHGGTVRTLMGYVECTFVCTLALHVNQSVSLTTSSTFLQFPLTQRDSCCQRQFGNRKVQRSEFVQCLLQPVAKGEQHEEQQQLLQLLKDVLFLLQIAADKFSNPPSLGRAYLRGRSGVRGFILGIMYICTYIHNNIFDHDASFLSLRFAVVNFSSSIADSFFSYHFVVVCYSTTYRYVHKYVHVRTNICGPGVCIYICMYIV